MATKPYKTHLLERLQTLEDRVGYLRAVFEDGDNATIERAVQDVCEASADAVWERAILAGVGTVQPPFQTIEIINALKAARTAEREGKGEHGSR
jgi:hypothetical protein